MDYTGLYNNNNRAIKYKQTPFGGGGERQNGWIECHCPTIDGTQVICGYKRTQKQCERCCKQGASADEKILGIGRANRTACQ